jgi:hypothetical protein
MPRTVAGWCELVLSILVAGRRCLPVVPVNSLLVAGEDAYQLSRLASILLYTVVRYLRE